MDTSKIPELLEEIRALYDCYLKLEEWYKNAVSTSEKNAANSGKWVIAVKLREILDREDVYPIFAANDYCPLDDFYYNVGRDMPAYIMKLEKYLQV